MHISIKGSFLILLMAFLLVAPHDGMAQSNDEPQNQDEHLGLVFDPMAGGIIDGGYLFPVTDTFPGSGHTYTYTIPYSTTHPSQTWTPPTASPNIQTESYVDRKIREIKELELEMNSETDPEKKAELKTQLDGIINMITDWGTPELKTALENRNQITPSGPPITYTQVPMYTQTLGGPPPTWTPPGDVDGQTTETSQTETILYDSQGNRISSQTETTFYDEQGNPLSSQSESFGTTRSSMFVRGTFATEFGDDVNRGDLDGYLLIGDPGTGSVDGAYLPRNYGNDADFPLIRSGDIVTQTLGSTNFRYDTNGNIIEEDQTTTRGGVTTRTRTQNYLDRRVQQIIDLEERAKTTTNAGERTRLENQAQGLRAMINDFGSQELRNSLQQAAAANAPTPSINN